MMPIHEKEITKEQYNRAMNNHGYIDDVDKDDIFSASELYGYGVYDAVARLKDNKYIVRYSTGSTCD